MADPNVGLARPLRRRHQDHPFLADIFRRLVAICLRRGAVPIGGMATALPSNDPEVNRVAGESIRNDKVWEAEQGFIRAWVAHIFHMKTAADPFRALHGAGSTWKPRPEMLDPDRYPIRIEVPAGPITLEGTRRNARMVVEYVEGWLNGRGAKGIDSLAGKPGVHPALMEDLATGRMSVAQIAQRVRHRARHDRGPRRGPRSRPREAAPRRGARRYPGPAPVRRDRRAGPRGHRGGGALRQGGEDRDALDQELHRPRLHEPRRVHARGARGIAAAPDAF